MCFVIANSFVFACLFLFVYASCVFKLLCGFLFFKNWNRDTVGVFVGLSPPRDCALAMFKQFVGGVWRKTWMQTSQEALIATYLLTYLLAYSVQVSINETPTGPFHKEHKGT